MNTKYIFITGGVVSSLGKGIVAASLAKLLQASGYKVTIQKIDPYLNIDPGTMNPYEHGEVFVTEDGAETDLDLGHYERFLNIQTSKENNITSGSVYFNVINKEREGLYQGKTVQVVPHITDEIKQRITLLAKKEYEIVLVEIGGTVGDIESLPYIEAIRQLKYELGQNQALFIHVTLVPYIAAADELKTKPTQHSVKTLLSYGVQPDILVCRAEREISTEIRKKIALFCNVRFEEVIQALDAQTIYEVPFLLKKEKIDGVVLRKLNLIPRKDAKLQHWEKFLHTLKNPIDKITIAVVGKYVEHQDAYKSIKEAIIHAGVKNKLEVDIKWIHSEDINEENVERKFAGITGILVAPGFGKRGIAGKLIAIKYARENNIPFLGICLGMQTACIEFARNVLNLQKANSTEFDPETPDPVIHLMENQKKITKLGGTMRLGAYECKIKKGTLAYKIYKTETIMERHRHRYEFNNKYRKIFQENGMIISGTNPKLNLVEIIEYKKHPFFIGCQFHPEFKSTVENAHPLFINFIANAYKLSK